MSDTLLSRTLELLSEFKGSWREISDETGIPYDWVSKVGQGVIKDPGVNRTENLYRHLLKLKKKRQKERAA